MCSDLVIYFPEVQSSSRVTETTKCAEIVYSRLRYVGPEDFLMVVIGMPHLFHILRIWDPGYIKSLRTERSNLYNTLRRDKLEQANEPAI